MKEILEYQIFQYGHYSLQVHNLVEVIVVVVLAKIILLLLSKAISKNNYIDAGAKYSVRQLVKYPHISFIFLFLMSMYKCYLPKTNKYLHHVNTTDD